MLWSCCTAAAASSATTTAAAAAFLQGLVRLVTFLCLPFFPYFAPIFVPPASAFLTSMVGAKNPFAAARAQVVDAEECGALAVVGVVLQLQQRARRLVFIPFGFLACTVAVPNLSAPSTHPRIPWLLAGGTLS